MYRSIAALALLLLPPLLAPPSVQAQARVAVAEENFRATPGGAIVATLAEGTPLPTGAVRDRWREATLDGWVWSPSTRLDTSSGLDVRVTAKGGENLRSGPGGARIGHLVEGARLKRVGENGRWLHVRRSGWIWNASIEDAAGEAPAPASSRDSSRSSAPVDAASTAPARDSTRRAAPRDSLRAMGGADSTTEGARRDSALAHAAGRPARYGYAPFAGTVLSDTPGGDTTAIVPPLAPLQLLERDGDWVRVRIEGWVRTSDVAFAPDSGGVLGDSDVAALKVQGATLRGRPVRWSLSFLSLQQAESVRTDFRPGEPFILARGPGDLDRLVYVAVPDSLLARVRALAPLQRFTAFGRIRTSRSRQTGAPVIDLLELR